MGNASQNLHNLFCQAINTGKVIFSRHAEFMLLERGFFRHDAFNCVFTGYIFEVNQSSSPLPTCSIAGKSKSGQRLYTIWAYNEVTGFISLITLYNPDSNRWTKCHIYTRM
ncbi:DUF4258 domain-containing protein [Anabaena sphaerica FACHB-251]|uniref:DUF4258 domain-containing protein n=1 Tax=Anabaena sphaerica FACHB-251 TaxID=2692883 RepID=A0A926WJW1_9NOST|nr:DUF4258 domain-containing protein [Anabaena sphaerica]MBD2295767.1 DUF4258 domain-containing protein [Anabaena sphaerica FACHB-251]